MQRKTLRAVVFAGALAAMSIPVFSGTQSASACSIPGQTDANCSISAPIGGTPIESYYSPLVLDTSSASSSFGQTQVGGERTVTVRGNVSGLTVRDLRGNNEGFAVSLQSNGASSSMTGVDFNGTIPAAYFSVDGTPTVSRSVCQQLYGYTPVCEAITATGTNANLGASQYVAYGCPVEGRGLGVYDVSVPVVMTLPADSPANIAFQSTGSFFPSWTATVTEGSSLNQLQGAPFNCPSISPLQ